MFVRTLSRSWGPLLVASLAVVAMLNTSMAAAPFSGAPQARLAQVNVEWMSEEQAAALNLSFPVLVPSWVPAPFAGAPSVQAGGGYYSLYWMVPGGDPTFLQVAGEVGGAMPVGSPADLNVRLEINASVNGYDAIHDVTAIYDNVWWVQGGVLYTVSSKNMTGTDSLALANSLVQLQPPVQLPTSPPPTPTPEPVESSPSGAIYNAAEVPSANIATIEAWPSATSTLRATHGSFSASGASFLSVDGGIFSWQAPVVDRNTTVEFTLIDDATGEVTAWSSIVVYPTSTGSSTLPVQEPITEPETGVSSGPTSMPADDALPSSITSTSTAAVSESASQPTTAITTSATDEDEGDTSASSSTGDATTSVEADTGTSETVTRDETPEAGGAGGGLTSDGTAGPPMPRTGDGTSGPSLPAGGDGTGGIRQIAVP